jgi:hypothetical protein
MLVQRAFAFVVVVGGGRPSEIAEVASYIVAACASVYRRAKGFHPSVLAIRLGHAVAPFSSS